MVADPLDDFARLAAACRLAPAATQQVFSALMHSSARPGTPARLNPIPDIPPVLLPLLAMCDLETSIAVCGEPPETARWASLVTAITGARAEIPTSASWIAVIDPTGLSAALGAGRGSPEAPETAARVFVAVRSLHGSTDQHPSAVAAPVSVTGPGVDGTATFGVDGIDPDAIATLGAADTFPCGLDVWLVDDSGCVVGLPRSCRVTTSDGRTI